MTSKCVTYSPMIQIRHVRRIIELLILFLFLPIAHRGKVLQEGHEHLLKLRKGDVVRVVWGPSCRPAVDELRCSFLPFLPGFLPQIWIKGPKGRKMEMKYEIRWNLWKSPSPLVHQSLQLFFLGLVRLPYIIFIDSSSPRISQVSRIEPQQSLGREMPLGTTGFATGFAITATKHADWEPSGTACWKIPDRLSWDFFMGKSSNNKWWIFQPCVITRG